MLLAQVLFADALSEQHNLVPSDLTIVGHDSIVRALRDDNNGADHFRLVTKIDHVP